MSQIALKRQLAQATNELVKASNVTGEQLAAVGRALEALVSEATGQPVRITFINNKKEVRNG